jgi:hypothetical protein
VTAHESEAAGVRTVFLHIGTMKTGTTYLQSRLKEHRNALARDGVLTPAGQLTALRDFFSRRGTLGNRDVAGSWEQMIGKLRTTDCARGVVSMEFLSTATPTEIREVVADFAPAEVHVIVTVRDLPRVMAAQWQETIQNRAVWAWEEYSAEIIAHLGTGVSPTASATASAGASGASAAGDDVPATREAPGTESSIADLDDVVVNRRVVRRTAAGRFWRQHDVARIVHDWSAAVGAERLHIVTVPRIGQAPDLLWERFTSVVGVDGARYQRGNESVRSNLGIDLAAAEFLRRLNVRLDPDLSRAAYLRHVKHLLGKTALVGRDPALKPTLTSDQHDRVVEHSESLSSHLRDLGVDVVGDLTDLLPAPLAGPATHPAGWLDHKVADASIDAVLAVLQHLDDLGPTIAAGAERVPAEAGDSGRRAQRRRDRREARDAAATRPLGSGTSAS